MIVSRNGINYSPELDAQFFAAYIGGPIMLDIKKIPASILADIAASLPSRDCSPDSIARLSPYDAMDAYLRYNGIIGYTSSLLAAWKAISEAEQKTTLERIADYDFAETVADIAFELGHANCKLTAEDSRANVSAIIQAATEFQRAHEGVSWGIDKEYLEEIDKYIAGLQTYPL